MHKSRSVPALSTSDHSYQEEIDVGEISVPRYNTNSKVFYFCFSRISGFSRSVAAYLSNLVFPPILNRLGKQASFIEPSTTRQLNMELELNTRLDTHEILIQFMAIST